jgi:NAD(P)-dependent dehydrogenase (short-subunit alcohol dehydrogenase family)
VSGRPVAVVTGAGRGIGRATAIALARGGYAVVAAARTPTQLADVAGAIRREGGTAIAVPADVGTTDGVVRIFEQAGRNLGPPTLLVNNAATLERSDFESIDLSDLDRTLAVNTRGAFLCAIFAFRAMVGAGGGCIVNIASLSGVAGVEKFPGLAPYVVSKFGVVGLTEVLAVEGRRDNIRAVCLAPGAVDTDLLKRALPQMRAGVSPEEVARLIVFLASDAAAPLNGLTIPLMSNVREDFAAGYQMTFSGS